MRLGAIVVIGTHDEALGHEFVHGTPEMGVRDPFGEAVACIEVVGRSTVERIIDRFLSAEVEVVSVFIEAEASRQQLRFRKLTENVTVEVVDEIHSAVDRKLTDYAHSGIEHSVINTADALPICIKHIQRLALGSSAPNLSQD